MTRRVLHDGLRAALPGAIFSGLPSTLYALLGKRDVLEASTAAGSILLRNETRTGRLLAAAVPVHIALSVGWSVVLAACLPLKRPVIEGVGAGLVIAGFDLGIVGSRYLRIRALDAAPQIADHVVFGILVATELAKLKDHQEA